MKNKLTGYEVVGAPVATILLAISIAGFSSINVTEVPANSITVSSAEELSQIREYLGRGNSGVIFEIDQDISLSEYLEDSESGWLTIGNDFAPENRFYGTLHGNGYLISGLWMVAKHDWSGLFGALGDSGAICDLRVEINSEKGGVTGNAIAGGIVGSNYGSIRNCSVSSTGEAGVSGSINVGGMTGYQNGGEVIGCHAQINVFATGGTISCVGGLVGLSDYVSAVTDSGARGNIYSDVDLDGNSIVGSGLDGDRVGGLIGMQDRSSTCTGCFSTGDVRSDGENDDVGGLIGRTYNTDLSLMQYDGGIVNECFSVGDVFVNGFNTFSGGLIGNSCDGVISNSYSKGNLNITGKHLYIGSFLGFLNRAVVENCYAMGHIDADASEGDYIGGVVGYTFESTVTASFFNEGSVGHFNGVGNGEGGAFAIDSVGMSTPSTFINANWNLLEIWGVYSSEQSSTGYGPPYLRRFFNNVLVTPTEMTVKYDGTTYHDPPKWTSDNSLIGIMGELCYVDSEGAIVNPRNAGKYLISIGTLSVDEHHHMSFINGRYLTIEPAEITIDLSDEHIVYNDDIPEGGTITVSGPDAFYDGNLYNLIDSSDVRYAFKSEGGNIYTVDDNVPVGAFNRILIGGVLENYSIEFTGRLTVDPMVLTEDMVSGITEYEYDGFLVPPEIYVHDGHSMLVGGEDYVLSSPEAVRIGDNVIRVRGLKNHTGSVFFEYSITASPPIKSMVESINSIPEISDAEWFRAVIDAYSLFIDLKPHERDSLPENDLIRLNNAVENAQTGGYNSTDGRITVEYDMPWYVCVDTDDIEQDSEEWETIMSIAEEYMGDREHNILSAFTISFVDLLSDAIWNPSGEIDIFFDSNASVTEILHISNDQVTLLGSPRSIYDVPASDLGMFVMISETGKNEIPSFIIGIVALLIIGVTVAYILNHKRTVGTKHPPLNKTIYRQ